jgi:peptide-methionine (S)-S-oxide reductase
MTQEVATLGGGCFWCLEAVYDDLQGVTDVVSGYTGGHINNPTYRQICTGTTGHAEVVKVTFDSDVISYRQILDVFFTIHDPTTLNRQGADVGTQYRSAIYVHSAEQRTIAEEALQFAQGNWANKIVTEITDAPTFYPAEDYHQEYYANNPNAGYCQVVIAPKVAKFRKEFLAQLKK